RATRHPSLSGLWIVDCGLQIANDRQLIFAVQSGFYFAFLIALTIASKSGQSPVSSLEWRSLPLARISKAPPLEGMSFQVEPTGPAASFAAASHFVRPQRARELEHFRRCGRVSTGSTSRARADGRFLYAHCGRPIFLRTNRSSQFAFRYLRDG